MNSHSLFVRIGWMQFYQGVQENDPKPSGGGAYNEDHVGHEVYNFKLISGKYYGYFQPPKGRGEGYGKRVNLRRILRDADGPQLEDLTVVFVSRRRSGEPQVVVGWFRNARLYGEMQESGLVAREKFGFLTTTSKGSAVLLPTERRDWEVPRGKGGMGQANICYPLGTDGAPKDLPWWEEILHEIEGYDGPNSLENERLEVEELVARMSGGQGFGLNAAERKQVELHAMEMAKRHFRGEGFEIEDTSASKPYDLLCRKDGEALYVEVKGSTGASESIFLTRNEVKHAQNPEHTCALFVVSSIVLDRRDHGTTPNGGHQRVIMPWRPNPERLEALQFVYSLSGHEAEAGA